MDCNALKLNFHFSPDQSQLHSYVRCAIMIKTDAGPSVKSALPFDFCLAQHHLLARIQVSIITRTCQIIFTVSDFANIERFPNCPNILCYEDPPDPLYRIPSTTPFIEFLPLLIEKIVLPCILHQLSHI